MFWVTEGNLSWSVDVLHVAKDVDSLCCDSLRRSLLGEWKAKQSAEIESPGVAWIEFRVELKQSSLFGSLVSN